MPASAPDQCASTSPRPALGERLGLGTPRRSGTLALAALLLVAAVGGGATWLLHSAPAHPPTSPTAATAPAATATTPGATASATPGDSVALAIPDTLTVPGHLDLAWPASGQAAIAVDGVGTIGTSGPTDTPQPIASVTKTMTAYVILKDHPLALGQDGPTVTVAADEAAELPVERALHQSLIPVHDGQRFTEREALQALMLASADNMAQILARWDAGSEAAFVERMNSTAATLKMTHTTFSQPSGYRPGSASTAPDLIRLGEAALTDPFFADLVDQRTATIPGGTVHNYNALLGTDGVTGIKTGSTNWAGGCLLFAVRTTIHGHPITLVGAVLGQPGTMNTMLPNVFAASRHLIISTMSALTPLTALPAGHTVATRTTNGTPTSLTLPHAPDLITWPGLTLHLRTTGTPAAPTLEIRVADSTLTTPLTSLTG